MAETGDRPEKRPGETSAGEADAAGRTERAVFPVVQEEAEVSVRRFQSGAVTVRTEPFERTERVEAELEHTEVEVERVPVGREVEEMQPVREEGDVTIVPIHEEVLVVRKQLIVKEELRLRRRKGIRKEEIDVTLRGQRPIVERSGPADGGDSLPEPEDPAGRHGDGE